MHIVETKAEALELFNEVLTAKGHDPLSEDEAADWGLSSGMRSDKIEELAKDFISESHTIKQDNKNSWMYEV